MGNLLYNEKLEINQLKLMNKFENLKNDFFLRKLFNNIEKKRALYILKYNKNIRQRININNTEFKEYSEKYTSIEIEIKPIQNKYGTFINIINEGENYYHIYFDNDKEEIKRNYIKEDEQIKRIYIIIEYQIKSFERLFQDCKCIESIYFKKFYRNNINNISYMFFECSSLKELNLSKFNTNNVNKKYSMLYGCSL